MNSPVLRRVLPQACCALQATKHIKAAMPAILRAPRCSVEQRWMSDKAKKPNDELQEWDRTINEAIEQAKRELSEQQEKQRPSKEQKPPKEKPPEGNDYVTTLGRVMIELPHQIEGFFDAGLDGKLYAENVQFAEPRHSGIQLHGKQQYLGMARVLRIAMNAYFSNPRVTILRMRQMPLSSSSSNAGAASDVKMDKGSGQRVEVYVRWVFEGTARHMELIGGHESRYEGEFRYAIDPKSGLIAVHEVTAIHPAPPTSVLATSGLARWAGWLSPRGSLSLSRRC
ncbi:hypothetical protein IWW36_001788 [Coemansia brasiliensis]|uniref:Uncharacterized protein n=1 Tax=Coemansia brasiliensis TaxID=2650707 RepID=A0A9W8M030_9FUNG|nr:hypothetical protein IWW36_001788 [Coemansia brasiliensis]